MKESSSPGLPTPHKDRLIVLPLDGEIDLNVLPDVATALNGMIAKKPQQLVVDLPRVTYIDSAGVAALIQAMQGVEAYSGKFAQGSLQQKLRTKLEESRLDRVL